jgi:hypothetical protein
MNAVVKQNHIETIYDHSITDAEMQQLTAGYPEPKEEYFYALDKDSAYADLFRLYTMRHDENKAAFFLNQIEDASFRRQLTMRPCCAGHS